MAEAKQNKVDQANKNMSKEKNENPPDLLQKLSQEKTLKETKFANPQEQEQPDQTDLNLKLSLGGIYNETSTKEKPLKRSSSITGVITLNKESPFLCLSRSSSLPAGTQKKQKTVNVKELQAMKRVEIVKKVVEKKKSSDRGTNEKDKSPMPEIKPPCSPSKVVAWASASVIKSPAFRRAIVKIKEDNKKLEGLKEMAAVEGSSGSKSSSQPVIASSGSKSSSQPVIASSGSMSSSQPVIASSGSKSSSQPVIASETKANGKSVEPAETVLENPSKKAKVSNGDMPSNGMDAMKQMPTVTTIGDGPNGKRVEGFLYRYMKGQVSIVCVCHGRFLSPEEFVKHAGGKDVTNPMKHINVSPISFSY